MKKGDSKKVDISWKLYSLIIFVTLALFIGSVVYATDTNAPRNFGHTAGEVYISVDPDGDGVTEEMTLQNAIANGIIIHGSGSNEIDVSQVSGLSDSADIIGRICCNDNACLEYSDGTVGATIEYCDSGCVSEGICADCKYEYDNSPFYFFNYLASDKAYFASMLWTTDLLLTSSSYQDHYVYGGYEYVAGDYKRTNDGTKVYEVCRFPSSLSNTLDKFEISTINIPSFSLPTIHI